MEWFYLIIAGVLEICWAMGLKYSQEVTKTLPNIITIVAMVASIYFLSLSLKSLPIGTAYAIWTGIGTIGTVLLGVILFKESINIIRIVCIVLIVSGIIGLKLISSE